VKLRRNYTPEKLAALREAFIASRVEALSGTSG
jgi:hypothetical protein